MFCEATSELETAFLKTLGETATYRVSDSELVLRTRDGQEARFKPASK
jgi:hypothetical protein